MVQGFPSGCGWFGIPGIVAMLDGGKSCPKLKARKTISHRATNPASNTNQPKRVLCFCLYIRYVAAAAIDDDELLVLCVLFRIPYVCRVEVRRLFFLSA